MLHIHKSGISPKASSSGFHVAKETKIKSAIQEKKKNVILAESYAPGIWPYLHATALRG